MSRYEVTFCHVQQYTGCSKIATEMNLIPVVFEADSTANAQAQADRLASAFRRLGESVKAGPVSLKDCPF